MSTSLPLPILHRHLGHRLSRHRRWRNESAETVATRLNDILRTTGNFRRTAPECTIARLFESGGIDAIEAALSGTIEITDDDLAVLADAYHLDRILLDTILATPAETVCLVQPSDQFLTLERIGDLPYGRGVTLGIPGRALSSAEDVALALIEIEPGRWTKGHRHSGDEFLLVRQGDVDVLLGDLGVQVHLRKHDYLHFYSEQYHRIVNCGEKSASVLVLRAPLSDSRAELTRELGARSIPGALTQLATQELEMNVYCNATNSIPGNLRHEGGNHIMDRRALASLLRQLCSDEFREPDKKLTLNVLAQRGGAYGLKRTKFHRLHHGTADIQERDLGSLATVYETDPLLLYNFLAPSFRSAVQVCMSRSPGLPSEAKGDYWTVPSEFVGNDEAEYCVPCRRLADAQLALAVVDLPPYGKTMEHRHPGHQIIVPLQGSSDLRFDETVTRFSAEEHVFLHFSSRHRHRVVNTTTEPCQFLALRT